MRLLQAMRNTTTYCKRCADCLAASCRLLQAVALVLAVVRRHAAQKLMMLGRHPRKCRKHPDRAGCAAAYSRPQTSLLGASGWDTDLPDLAPMCGCGVQCHSAPFLLAGLRMHVRHSRALSSRRMVGGLCSLEQKHAGPMETTGRIAPPGREATAVCDHACLWVTSRTALTWLTNSRASSWSHFGTLDLLRT